MSMTGADDITKILQEFVTRFHINETNAKIVIAKFLVANCAANQLIFTNLFGEEAATAQQLNCSQVKSHFAQLSSNFWNRILGCFKFKYALDSGSKTPAQLIFYNCNNAVAAGSGETKHMPILSKIIDRIGSRVNAPDLVFLLAELCNCEKFIAAIRSNPLTAKIYSTNMEFHYDLKAIHAELNMKRTADPAEYCREIATLISAASIIPPVERIERIPEFNPVAAERRIAQLETKFISLKEYATPLALEQIQMDLGSAQESVMDGDASEEMKFTAREHNLVKQIAHLERAQLPVEEKMKKIQRDISRMVDRYQTLIEVVDWQQAAHSEKADLFFQSLKGLLKIAHFLVPTASPSFNTLKTFQLNLNTYIGNLKEIEQSLSIPLPLATSSQPSFEIAEKQESIPFVVSAAVPPSLPPLSLKKIESNGDISIGLTTVFSILYTVAQIIGSPLELAAAATAGESDESSRKLQIKQIQALVIALFTTPCEQCDNFENQLVNECDAESDRCQMLNKIVVRGGEGEKAFLGRKYSTVHSARRRMATVNCGEIMSIGEPPSTTTAELREVTPERARKVQILRILDTLVAIVLENKIIMNLIGELMKSFIEKLPPETAAALTDEQKVLLFFGIFIAPESQEVAFEVLKSLKLPIRPKASTTKKIIKMRASRQDVHRMYRILIKILREMEQHFTHVE